MKTIKRYVDGRYFDMNGKKFIKQDDLAALLTKGAKVRIVQSRTGDDVTAEVKAELVPEAPRTRPANPFIRELKRRYLVNLRGVRRHMKKTAACVRQRMQLASRDQVADLTARVAELGRMVADLEKSGPRPTAGPGQTAPSA